MSYYNPLDDEEIFGPLAPFESKNTCSSCAWWRGPWTTLDNGEDEWGECHRKAPVATTHPETDHEFSHYATWPIVSTDESCGEWVSKR